MATFQFIFFVNQPQFWSVEKLNLSKKRQAEVSHSVPVLLLQWKTIIILSSIHQDEIHFEISEFSGERVLQIPTVFMSFAITGSSSHVIAHLTISSA